MTSANSGLVLRWTVVISVVVLISLGAAWEARAVERNDRLSYAAGVTVLCYSGAEWHMRFADAIERYTAGAAYDGRILLRRESCERIALLPRWPRVARTQHDVAVAVFLLGHELAHHRGIPDEKLADCESLRRYGWLLKRLGLESRHYADILFAQVSAGSACPRR